MPTLRTQDELNKEYTDLCLKLGDNIHKMNLLGAENQEIQKKMIELAREKVAPPVSPPESLL